MVCELVPMSEDVLVQVADDIFRDSLADYRMHGYDPEAEQLREAATRRMSSPPDEAQSRCARLLREYQAYLRRLEADEED